VQATDFDGSDNEVYQESEESDCMRDDLTLSDDVYDDDQESNEEEKERQFFGDEDYTLLSRAPTQEDTMSQTMQQKELKERRLKLQNLIRDFEQIEARVRQRKQEG
jgi:hypothetical protein